MNAVRCVDFQFWRTLLKSHFVHGSRAKILAGISVFTNASVTASIRIENYEVAGLIFFMTSAGMVDVGEAIEGQLAIALKAR